MLLITFMIGLHCRYIRVIHKDDINKFISCFVQHKCSVEELCIYVSSYVYSYHSMHTSVHGSPPNVVFLFIFTTKACSKTHNVNWTRARQRLVCVSSPSVRLCSVRSLPALGVARETVKSNGNNVFPSYAALHQQKHVGETIQNNSQEVGGKVGGGEGDYC